jgi:cell division protein FtsZ
MIVVPNERLLAVVGKNIPFQDALKKADEVLLRATEGISGLVTKCGIINVDFADVRTVMKDGGAAIMGTGVGSGENRAVEAAQIALSSPLLDDVSIAGATGVLVNITGGDGELSFTDFTTVGQIVQEAVGEEANIIIGAGVEPAMVGQVRVTVVATGFEKVQAAGTKGRPGHGANSVISIADAQRTRPVIGSAYSGGTAVPAQRQRATPAEARRIADLSDMEIPTFIRRQMD